MVARGNGLDIVFLAASARIRPEKPDNSGVAVRTNDKINGPKDLVGKKVSAGLINGPNYVHMREWLQRNGVDPASVEFLELPFPQMADALFQNRLDAVWNVEPFLTFMVKSGNARVIAYPYQENVPRMDITGYVAKITAVQGTSLGGAKNLNALFSPRPGATLARRRAGGGWPCGLIWVTGSRRSWGLGVNSSVLATSGRRRWQPVSMERGSHS